MITIPRSGGRLDRGRHRSAGRERSDPPLRLAHMLYVLWVAGSVAWALYAAALAHEMAWWEARPHVAAGAVLLPPALGHLLGIWITRVTGNPRV